MFQKTVFGEQNNDVSSIFFSKKTCSKTSFWNRNWEKKKKETIPNGPIVDEMFTNTYIYLKLIIFEFAMSKE